MILLSLAVALCFSLPGCLPSVLPPGIRPAPASGPPGTLVSLATHACARVQSDCLLPGILAALTQDSLVFLFRALWSRPSDRRFCEIHSAPRLTWASFSNRLQTDHRQGALDRSRSSFASQDFGIPAVFITKASPDSSEAPDTSGAQVSHGVSLFQVGVPGAIVSGSFMRDPVFSPRDPVDALDRIFFASASRVRCNLASRSGASHVGL